MERSVRLSRRRRGSDRGGAGSRAITFGRWDGMGSVSVGPRSFQVLTRRSHCIGGANPLRTRCRQLNQSQAIILGKPRPRPITPAPLLPPPSLPLIQSPPHHEVPPTSFRRYKLCSTLLSSHSPSSNQPFTRIANPTYSHQQLVSFPPSGRP